MGGCVVSAGPLPIDRPRAQLDIERALLDARPREEADLDWALAELSATKRKLDERTEALRRIAQSTTRWADNLRPIARRALA